MRGQPTPRPILPAIAGPQSALQCRECRRGYALIRSDVEEPPLADPTTHHMWQFYLAHHGHDFLPPEPVFDSEHCTECHNIGDLAARGWGGS